MVRLFPRARPESLSPGLPNLSDSIPVSATNFSSTVPGTPTPRAAIAAFFFLLWTQLSALVFTSPIAIPSAF